MIEPLPIKFPCRFDVTPPIPLAKDIDREIDLIWTKAKSNNPDLHDGSAYSVLRFRGNCIQVEAIRYRDIIATRQNPRLRRQLLVCPLAVTGILKCRDGWVLGRRSGNVTQNPGCWELVPSGGVEVADNGKPPSLETEILRELHEEIGMTADHVSVGTPIGALRDQDAHCIDIVLPIDTALSGADVVNLHAHVNSREYTEIGITQDPWNFIATQDGVVETTRAILEHFLSR